ncbi:MAG: hypothetical protein MUC63_06410, partial [Planctomycetes bacterium]|nr:hypothetical protein [Planctomycetota bacterium]
MRIRSFSCPSCGAVREAREDAVVLFCAHCGSFLALDTGRFFRGRGLADLRDRALAGLAGPGAGERRAALASDMAKAQARGDRAEWRRTAEEFYALLAAAEPWIVPPAAGPDPVARWLLRAVDQAEFLAFCPEAGAAQAAYAAAAGRLGRGGDPVDTARLLLAEAEQAWRTISSHPEYPGDLAPASCAHMARQWLRASVTGMEAMLGPGVALRIYREVLGDAVLPAGAALRCSGCGASLEGERGPGRARSCPHCGAVVHAEDEDPWLLNCLALWEASTAGTPSGGPARGDLETVFAALAVAMGPLWMGAELEPTPVLGFLKKAVPQVGDEALLDGNRNYAAALGGEPRFARFFDGLLALIEEKMGH